MRNFLEFFFKISHIFFTIRVSVTNKEKQSADGETIVVKNRLSVSLLEIGEADTRHEQKLPAVVLLHVED